MPDWQRVDIPGRVAAQSLVQGAERRTLPVRKIDEVAAPNAVQRSGEADLLEKCGDGMGCHPRIWEWWRGDRVAIRTDAVHKKLLIARAREFPTGIAIVRHIGVAVDQG